MIGEIPTRRDQRRYPMLKIAEISLEGRVLILEPVRRIHGHPPIRIGAQIHHLRSGSIPHRSFQNETARISHHRAWGPEQCRPMRDVRHVEYERSEDVTTGTKLGREIEGLEKMVVHVALRRAAPDQHPITEKQIATIARNRDVQRHRGRIRDLETAPKHPDLVVRRRGGITRRHSVRALGGPNPNGGIDKGFFWGIQWVSGLIKSRLGLGLASTPGEAIDPREQSQRR